MGYDYEIRYKKGRENIIVDALSRMHSGEMVMMSISTISSNLMYEIQSS